jgi:hypothetical protein
MIVAWAQLETQVTLLKFILLIEMFNTGIMGNANHNDISVMTKDQSSIEYPRQPHIQKYNKDMVNRGGHDLHQQNPFMKENI